MGLLWYIGWWGWLAIAATVWAFAGSRPERVLIVLLPLAMIALTPRRVRNEESVTKPSKFPLFSFALAGFAVFIAGADYHPVTWWPILVPGAAIAAAGLGVLHWKGVSLGGRKWTIPAAGLALYGIGAVTLLNGALDRETRRYQTTVTAKYTTTFNRTTHYEVSVSGLAGGSAEISLGKERWNQTSRGDRIPVDYHPGALGYPWIVWQ